MRPLDVVEGTAIKDWLKFDNRRPFKNTWLLLDLFACLHRKRLYPPLFSTDRATMSESTRNRLIGVLLLVASLPFAFWIEVDGGLGKIVDFGAGAVLGFSFVLLLTGTSFWSSKTWWTSQSPLERT
jgi:hypothetical protein